MLCKRSPTSGASRRKYQLNAIQKWIQVALKLPQAASRRPLVCEAGLQIILILPRCLLFLGCRAKAWRRLAAGKAGT